MYILDVPMKRNDAKAKTVRDYLKRLLSTVWVEDEGFDGKRPFGNSGWKYDVYAALIKAGVIDGKLDPGGCVEDVDDHKADKLILEAIKALN